MVLHGIGDPDIQIFEPRPLKDLNTYSAQTAVYATGDDLWIMLFAVLDRSHHARSASIARIRLVDETGKVSEPRFVFASASKPYNNSLGQQGG